MIGVRVSIVRVMVSSGLQLAESKLWAVQDFRQTQNFLRFYAASQPSSLRARSFEYSRVNPLEF